MARIHCAGEGEAWCCHRRMSSSWTRCERIQVAARQTFYEREAPSRHVHISEFPRRTTHLPISSLRTSRPSRFSNRLRTNRQNGSSSQQRKGHIGLGHPLLSQPACVAQDHSRAGRRAHLQAREEGRHPLPVRTPVAEKERERAGC